MLIKDNKLHSLLSHNPQAMCIKLRAVSNAFSIHLSCALAPLQVPPELKDDLILIADKIEPYLLEIKEQAKKLPEKAHELAQKIEPAAEQLGEKLEQGAQKECFCGS